MPRITAELMALRSRHAASMRPRLNAADDAPDLKPVNGNASFNEAAAECRGLPAS